MRCSGPQHLSRRYRLPLRNGGTSVPPDLLSNREEPYLQPPVSSWLTCYGGVPDTRLYGSITPGVLQVFDTALQR